MNGIFFSFADTTRFINVKEKHDAYLKIIRNSAEGGSSLSVPSSLPSRVRQLPVSHGAVGGLGQRDPPRGALNEAAGGGGGEMPP